LSAAHKDLVFEFSRNNLEVIAIVDAVEAALFLVAEFLSENFLYWAGEGSNVGFDLDHPHDLLVAHIKG